MRSEEAGDDITPVSSLSRPAAQSLRYDAPVSSVSRPDCEISIAKYKREQRTDAQARLFPLLREEISERRQKLLAPARDQRSGKFKQEICEMVRREGLVPAKHFEMFCERVLKPYSDRFWDEGCAAPTVKGFKANIRLKPDAVIRFRQPYHLSKFDETRLSYLYKEAEKEGKVEMFQLGEQPPPMATPTFMVDKKGSSIGRRVGDYTMLNKATEDYYHPPLEADQVLMNACGKAFHTVLDCV